MYQSQLQGLLQCLSRHLSRKVVTTIYAYKQTKGRGIKLRQNGTNINFLYLKNTELTFM